MTDTPGKPAQNEQGTAGAPDRPAVCVGCIVGGVLLLAGSVYLIYDLFTGGRVAQMILGRLPSPRRAAAGPSQHGAGVGE